MFRLWSGSRDSSGDGDDDLVLDLGFRDGHSGGRNIPGGRRRANRYVHGSVPTIHTGSDKVSDRNSDLEEEEYNGKTGCSRQRLEVSWRMEDSVARAPRGCCVYC